jgi:hypothetical protein
MKANRNKIESLARHLMRSQALTRFALLRASTRFTATARCSRS